MGYFLTLIIRSSNPEKPLKFLKASLKSASLTSEIIPGEKILPNTNAIFEIDDRTNSNFIDKSLKQMLFEYVSK